MQRSDTRQAALHSEAHVRIITGEPGVGKTYFGCQIADQELSMAGNHQVLFLTFSRNAVARIGQVYNQRCQDKDNKTRMTERIHLNTFAGFQWWLVEAYGRYVPGHQNFNRLWLIGKSRTVYELIPRGYIGYTFDELTAAALEVLRVPPVLKLISEIYPIVIIDEFQDVDKELLEIIKLLGSKSRLVLLSGPGQCIYRGLKRFDPDSIMSECCSEFSPEQFRLAAVDDDRQRHCPEIRALISQHCHQRIEFSSSWPVCFRPIKRHTQRGFPMDLETQAAILLNDMKVFLRNLHPGRRLSVGIFASTNQGVASISHRLRTGSESYPVRPTHCTLHFDDLLLLQYGRLMLNLLVAHWSSTERFDIDFGLVSTSVVSLFMQYEDRVEQDPRKWEDYSLVLGRTVRNQRPPRTASDPLSKVRCDLEHINTILHHRKDQLPEGTPSTPFNRTDGLLLRTLTDEFLKAISGGFSSSGLISIGKARELFERSMQQRIIFEKLGYEGGVQVMTIHKAKGREFDGGIVVFENNMRALWRSGSKSSEQEVEELYRVGISRSRFALGIVGFNDIYTDAKAAVQKLLPEDRFNSLPP